MPGANYFLSQVAAQTPGPLLGAYVPPKLSPPQCLELISTPRIEPYISVIGSKTNGGGASNTITDTSNTCKDVSNIARDAPNTCREASNSCREASNTCRDALHIRRDVSNICQDVAVLPPKHVSVYGNRTPKPRYNHSYSPSPPPISQAACNSIMKAPRPPLPPNPPGQGTASVPNPRKQDNPVGELQELCTKMRWVFPTYYIYCDEAQPHERAFCVVVKLYRFRERGEAKSKRSAKREAATRVLNRLRNWPADVPLQFNNPSPLPQSSKSVGLEVMPFKTSPVTPPASYFINELSMLSQKHNFSTVYVQVEEPTESGEVQFMLQLATWPVVVVKGSGRSFFMAKADAAKKALDCLKIMCKSYFTGRPRV